MRPQEQYVLVHEVILEWIKWGNTEIQVCELGTIHCGLGVEGDGEGEEKKDNVLERLFKVKLFR